MFWQNWQAFPRAAARVANSELFSVVPRSLMAGRLTGSTFHTRRAYEHIFFHMGPTICQVLDNATEPPSPQPRNVRYRVL